MNKLTKSDLGLGEVRNRVYPSMSEYEIINEKLNGLILNGDINGILSSLDSETKVIKDDTGPYPILKLDLSGVRTVKIAVDVNGSHLQLSNGTDGKSIIFEFLNEGSHDIQWMNLRVKGGLSPGLTPNSGDKPHARTIYEIIKLGREYYLINEIHGV